MPCVRDRAERDQYDSPPPSSSLFDSFTHVSHRDSHVRLKCLFN